METRPTHPRRACFLHYKCSFCIFAQRRGYFGGVGAVLRMTTTLCAMGLMFALGLLLGALVCRLLRRKQLA